MSKELFTALQQRGLLEFGSVIPASLVQETLGIKVPALGTKAEFDAIAMLELAAIDYVRRLLLREGKYLGGNKGDYRVFLPSENRKQVDIYMQHADKKLKRALLLSKNSPTFADGVVDQSQARIMLKRDSIRRHAGGSLHA